MAVLSHDGERSYVGAVIAERERNGYHDSDFYALVYDEAADATRWIEFATTRGHCGAAFGTYVDATDEVLDKAERCFARRHFDEMKRSDEDKARSFEKGKRATVTRVYRSRKLKRTLTPGEDVGTVVYYGRGFGSPYAEKYGRTPPMRVGIVFDGETEALFLDDFDAEVVGWEALLRSDDEVRAAAEVAGRNERLYYESHYARKYAEGRARNERVAAEAVAA